MPIRAYRPGANFRSLPGAVGSFMVTVGETGVRYTQNYEASGVYSNGDGEQNRFFLADIWSDQRLSFGSSKLVIGWPELHDISLDPELPARTTAQQTAIRALGATRHPSSNDGTPGNAAARARYQNHSIGDPHPNWLVDEDTGLVVPAVRTKIVLYGDYGRDDNAQAFIFGQATVQGDPPGDPNYIMLIGVDIVLAGTNRNDFHYGRNTAIGQNGNSGDQYIGFYDCSITNHSSNTTGTDFWRVKPSGSNIYTHGLRIFSNSAENSAFQYLNADGTGRVQNGFSFSGPSLTGTGGVNNLATTSGAFNNARSYGIPSTSVNLLRTNFSVNNIYAAPVTNTANARITIVDSPNVLKTTDTNNGRWSNLYLRALKHIQPTTITAEGSSADPDVVVYRQGSRQSWQKPADNTTTFTGRETSISRTDSDNNTYTTTDTQISLITNDDSVDFGTTAGATIGLDSNNIFNPLLLHYFESKAATIGTTNGANGPRVMMMNRYHIHITHYGNIPRRFPNFYLGGDAVDGSTSDTALPVSDYFGIDNIASRRTYPNNGVSLVEGNSIELPIDELITERNANTVQGYALAGIASWPQLYDALALHADRRSDGPGIDRGIRLFTHAGGVLDFGARNINQLTATPLQSQQNGVIGAINGTSTGDLGFFFNATFNNTAGDNGVSSIRTTGNYDFGSVVANKNVAAGNINNITGASSVTLNSSGNISIAGTSAAAFTDSTIARGQITNIPTESSFVRTNTTSSTTLGNNPAVLTFTGGDGITMEHVQTVQTGGEDVVWNVNDFDTANSFNVTLTGTLQTGASIRLVPNSQATRTELVRWANNTGYPVAASAGDDGIFVDTIVASYDLVFNVPTHTAALPVNGRIVVKNINADAIDYVGTITNGTLTWATPGNRRGLNNDTQRPFYSTQHTDRIRYYYKLDSTLSGSNRRAYRVAIGDVLFPSVTENVTIEPLEVNSFFIQDALVNSSLSYTFGASTGNTITGTFSSTSAAATTSRASSQAATIIAANSSNYLDWLVSNSHTVDLIDYQPAAVIFNQSVLPTLGANEGVVLVSTTNTTQTIVNNYTNHLTNAVGTDTLFAGTGIRQVINTPIGSADIATVTAAVGNTVSDTLNSNIILRNTENATGYMVENLRFVFNRWDRDLDYTNDAFDNTPPN